MIRQAFIAFVALWLCSCDPSRSYEETSNLPGGKWLLSNKPSYTFHITNDSITYNLYCDLRNTNEYPFSRLFFSYLLVDSLDNQLSNQMISAYLFNPRDGAPTGRSGIGDIFSHRLPLLANYRFPAPGAYTLTFQQKMRPDTLGGIVSVGLRVEKAAKPVVNSRP